MHCNSIFSISHYMSFKVIFISLIAFTGLSVSAQTKQTHLSRPNILWITCEDMSPHLSSFGETEIRTPNLDKLASDGIRFTNAYTVAGVCAPSRLGIITGLYPQSIGGDNHRNYYNNPTPYELSTMPIPPYSIVPPPFVKGFPEYLRKEGYYCTNNFKEDYQFKALPTIWDESSRLASWNNRPHNSPFFSIINLMITHESQVWARSKYPMLVDPGALKVPPYYPDTKETRIDMARNLTNIIVMDSLVGNIIKKLKDDNLYDNTIIFFYSDHGDGLPYVKREILVRGIHVPLIVKLQNNQNKGSINETMVSSIDFSATVLSLANVPVPAYMHGQAFLGKEKSPTPRKYIFAARDRMEAEPRDSVDRVRTVYDGRFQYVKNYKPNLLYYQNLPYRLNQQMMRKILLMKEAGELNYIQNRWFKTKPEEELYDVKNDPYEFKNLATDPKYQFILQKLRKVYNDWYLSVGDLHVLPEKELVKKMWSGRDSALVVLPPVLTVNQKTIKVSCATPGSSIAYSIKKYDNGKNLNNQLYSGKPIFLTQGDTLEVSAHRIGYEPSHAKYICR